jgi:hypothetical protein
LANDHRPRNAEPAGLFGSKGMLPAKWPSAPRLPTAERRCRQRLRKKTEAMLRVRIIMVDGIYTVRRRKQSILSSMRDGLLRFAMTPDADISFQIQEYAAIPGFPNPLYMINII